MKSGGAYGMEKKYQEVLSKINQADSILIGASNGLAISGGIHIFAENADYLENFGDFRKKYGFRNIVQGAFYPYPSEEEKWAFFSRMYAYLINNKEFCPFMNNLYELVKDKTCYVVTTNTDSHFTRSEERRVG